MKSRIFFVLPLLLLTVLAQGCLAALSGAETFVPVPELVVLPAQVERGGPARALLAGLPPEAAAEGEFDGKKVFFFPVEDVLVGLFGADVMIEPGVKTLKVAWTAGEFGGELAVEVPVKDKTYGIRDIKVPQKQVDLSPEDQARAARERKLVEAALALQTPVKLWTGNFIEPVDGPINSSFGRRTRLNGIMNPRPHAGADYLVPEGTEVRAPADGTVALTGDHFFSGQAVYLDHGQGLISMYFHLSRIDVADGRSVKKGDVLGLVGKTGRVTGAHLHYGVYLNGARIDPPAFRQMTTRLVAP
ncbi:MAG: M23 family metallopeptidase [Deltaproteobacteria bacterium]|jgi:murein DD-endopeptidase MepM/ murein hydrolase activator NlpD|nr:M23 family metallopeptidase [Deltaproteobacteria bacterium]